MHERPWLSRVVFAPCLGVLAASCVPAFDVPRPEVVQITEDIQVRRAPSSELFLVHLLSVSTDEPTKLTVELTGADTARLITFPTWSTDHEVPLLGLVEEADYTATAILTTDAGFEVTSKPVTFDAGLASAPTPLRTVHVNDTARMEPGYTIYPVRGVDGSFAAVEAIDDQGRLVWQFLPPPAPTAEKTSVTALEFHPEDGTLSGLVNNKSIRRFDFAHQPPDLIWTPDSELPADDDIVVSMSERYPFHDEAAFVADGSFWTFTHKKMEVLDYPFDATNPTLLGKAEIRTDIVVHVAPDGVVIREWDLWDYLDRYRVGFEGVGFPNLYDWSSANAIIPLGPEDFVVSLAHQNALVKFSGSSVEWILGNHDGWHAPYTDLLLEPTDPDLLWFSGQHGPAVDDEDRVWLFDNGSCDRGTPYEPSPDEPDYSRVVRYELDVEARTVSESFSFGEEGPLKLFSNSKGNADPLPETGHVLATYGAIHEEDLVCMIPEDDLSPGSMRILEIDPATSEVVFDLELTGGADESVTGWQGDRAIRVPQLYPADVVVTVVE